MEKMDVFITGATGYMGTRLIKRLLSRGHTVTALVRKGSEHKVPAGATVVVGNPFDGNTFRQYLSFNTVFVQLLGVAHPSPRKAEQFKEIDLRSVRVSANAASMSAVAHFIYVSVAMTPSRLMHAYQEIRKEGEQYCINEKLKCTVIRPWYVLGPGHWWPILLLPVYGMAELFPSARKKSRAMALVTINQMLSTLVTAVESKPQPLRILEIKDIRSR